MSKVSQVTPTPFDQRTPKDKHDPIEPKLGYTPVIAAAKGEAVRRGWKEPAGSAFYSPEYGIYGVAFYAPGNDHGTGGDCVYAGGGG